ncbi:MAG: catalase family peroxidase [Bryobacteraceae bacterium]|jgi:catalase
MPLPDDAQLIALSEELIRQFDTIFGLHPGFRPAHAKGALLTGTFTPASGADYYTRAPHIERPATPVTVRFSNSTGLPLIPDNDPNANPRGMAIRFHLGEHVHTDIVAHSTDGFPTHTGDEFLEFLRALVGGTIENYLGAHPKALAFVQTPKPTPSSFAREAYFGVTAMQFTNRDGLTHLGRYRIVPEAGVDHLSDADAAARGTNFLFDEIKERVAIGPVAFRIMLQLAGSDDVVDDATVHWPEDRPVVELGRLVLTAVVEDSAAEQKKIIFDPIPRVDGIEPSEDPLLELRAAVYLISGRRRRSA